MTRTRSKTSKSKNDQNTFEDFEVENNLSKKISRKKISRRNQLIFLWRHLTELLLQHFPYHVFVSTMAKKTSKSNVKVANKNRSKKTFAKRNGAKSINAGKRPQVTRSKSKGVEDTKRVPHERKDPKKESKKSISQKSIKQKSIKRKGIKRKFEDVESSDDGGYQDDDVETWEARPRYHFEDEVRQVESKQEEAGEETNEDISMNGQSHENQDEKSQKDENQEDENQDEKKEVPVVELLLKKKQHFRDLKDKVGSLAMSILADTQRNVLKLKTLVMLLDEREEKEIFPSLFVREQMLVAFSLLELFKDILPTYRVMEKTVEEMSTRVRMKKETKELRDYETTLLKYYKIFVDRMQRMIGCLKKKPKSNFYNFITSTQCRERLALVGAKCLSDLLLSHPHFNLRDELVKSIIPLLSSKQQLIREMIFHSVSLLYREDKSGHVSLSAVKQTAKLIKALKLDVEPLAIRSFLTLRIKEVKKKETEINMKQLRDKLDHLSKKDRKYNKKMLKLTAQMRETEATEDQKKKLEFHTQILNQIFFVYFRLLKDIIEFEEVGFEKRGKIGFEGRDKKGKSKVSECLTPVLEGLSKFCHLINVDFYNDLIGLLYKLVNSQTVDHHQIMFTTKTVFTILATEGYSVSVDPHRFYVRFYSCLPLLNSTNFGAESDAELFHDCLDKMFFKRRKHLSVSRVFAFCKRLSLVAIQTSPPMAALVLSAIRILMRDHPKCEILLDTEHFASASFLPQLDDPDFCNAAASRLWELHLLKLHSCPMIRLLALSILKGSQLTTDLLKKTPLEMYHEVVSSECKKLDQVIQSKVN